MCLMKISQAAATAGYRALARRLRPNRGHTHGG